jgi:hypothetical protein
MGKYFLVSDKAIDKDTEFKLFDNDKDLQNYILDYPDFKTTVIELNVTHHNESYKNNKLFNIRVGTNGEYLRLPKLVPYSAATYSKNFPDLQLTLLFSENKIDQLWISISALDEIDAYNKWNEYYNKLVAENKWNVQQLKKIIDKLK